MRDFRELKVWEKGHRLALAVYKSTAKFPQDELYGLNGDAELARFLGIAMGSASELEYQLLLAHDLNLLETAEYRELTREVTEVKRMLTSFIQKLKADG